MLAIGIDLGASNIRAALVEYSTAGDVQIVAREKRKIGENKTPEAVVGHIVESVKCLGADLPIALPIGLGTAGFLNGADGFILNSPNLGWINVPLGEMLKKHLGAKIVINNDLKAITWGEFRFGASRGVEHMVCVFCGTGVGAGAVSDGKLIVGAKYAALEIGHTVAIVNGRECPCGLRGCMEAYAGGRQLVLQGQENPSEMLLKLAGGDAAQIHAGLLDEAAEAGDVTSQLIIDRAAGVLAHSLGTLITTFNAQQLVMGGSVWTGCSRLRAKTQVALRDFTLSSALSNCALVEALLADDAGVLGAADLARLVATA